MPRPKSATAKRKRASAVPIEQLMDMTARELDEFYSEAEIRSTYESLRKSVASRLRTFERAGLGNIPPKSIQGGMAPMKGRSKESLIREISSAMGWIRGKRSTLKGYREVQEGFRKAMQEAMPDLDLSSKEKMDAYGEFMGEMDERYGAMWHSISSMVHDLYRDLTALNEDPREFMKNFDFWKQRNEEINKEKTAAKAPGRRRSTEFSSYVRQMKRKKIR